MTEASSGQGKGAPVVGSSCVGMVGLGLLGGAIAERVVATGRRVLGADIDAARVASLASSLVGLEPTGVAAIGRTVDRCILCLPRTEDVERVIEAEGGLLTGPRPTVRSIVDTTTGEPRRSERLAARLRGRGIEYIDATVSGSSREMREGRAVLLVGGMPEAIADARALLEALAPVIFHLGGPGAGQRAKLVHNLVIGLHRLVLAEGLVFGEALGLDPASLLEVLRAGPASSRVIDTKGRRMVEGDYAPDARLAQHLKDVLAMLDEGRESGASLPLTEAHRVILEEAVRAGIGDRDNSAVIEVLRRRLRERG